MPPPWEGVGGGLNFLQKFHEEVPELLDARNQATLVGCVGRAQGGTEGDEVHVGVDTADDAALQSGVADFHTGGCIGIHAVVDLNHAGRDGAVEVGLPGAVLAVVAYLHASHGEA